MSLVGGAIAGGVGAGAVKALYDYFTSGKKEDAANLAAEGQQQGFDMLAEERDYQRQRAEPGVQRGERGKSALEAATMTGMFDTAVPTFDQGKYGKWDPSMLQQDPGYKFELAQGLGAVEGRGAAKGNRLSGATLKELTNYGQGLASTRGQESYNRFNKDRAFAYKGDQDAFLNEQEQMQNRYNNLYKTATVDKGTGGGNDFASQMAEFLGGKGAWEGVAQREGFGMEDLMSAIMKGIGVSQGWGE